MTRATEAQKKAVREALATGGNLPDGVRIAFGDPEPIQKVGGASKADEKKGEAEK